MHWKQHTGKKINLCFQLYEEIKAQTCLLHYFFFLPMTTKIVFRGLVYSPWHLTQFQVIKAISPIRCPCLTVWMIVSLCQKVILEIYKINSWGIQWNSSENIQKLSLVVYSWEMVILNYATQILVLECKVDHGTSWITSVLIMDQKENLEFGSKITWVDT